MAECNLDVLEGHSRRRTQQPIGSERLNIMNKPPTQHNVPAAAARPDEQRAAHHRHLAKHPHNKQEGHCSSTQMRPHQRQHPSKLARRRVYLPSEPHPPRGHAALSYPRCIITALEAALHEIH